MPTLLHLDSSPMGDYSVSRHLTKTFVDHWTKANSGAKVIRRDTTTTPVVPVAAAWVGAVYTPAESRSEEQKQLLKLSDDLVAELQEADEYVIGVAMHNFGIPSTLKAWVDEIARVGVTFAYVDGAPKGLLKGKKATILIAAGGKYDKGTAMEGLNHVEPYLRSILGFLGVTDITFHTAGGAAALNYGADRAEFLKPHEDAVAGFVTK